MSIRAPEEPAKLTDEEWQLIEPLLAQKQHPHKSGRHRRDDREIFSAIIWVLDTKTSWRRLPQSFPPYPTCHRRYLEWEHDGKLIRARDKLRRFREQTDESR
ncbi:MAG: transposase [Ardenticatenales bacterium]|nr:transposase [Ardenticatenales bacterium]